MENKKNYGVISLIACGLAIFWSGFVCFGFPGVMGMEWQERFQVGPSETGLVVTFMLLALAVAMFFSGKIHMMLGMRMCILISMVIYILAFAILFMAKNIYMVYVWAFGSNLACSFVYGPGMTTVQQWFAHKKGIASGIINLIFGISAAILSPIWNHLLGSIGYQKANYLLLACIVVGSLIAAILVKDAPLDAANVKKNTGRVREDLTAGQALHTREFWMIWILWAFMGAVGISMVSLSKSYSVALGLTGVTLLTSFNLANGLIRIIVGTLTDIVGGERTGFVIFILSACGYFFLCYTTSLPLMCLCVILVGMGFGTLFTISGPIVSDIFGLKYFGMIFGLIFTGYGLVGGIVGPALAGFVLDQTGNYKIVFSYLAVFALIGAALIAGIGKRRKTRLLQ